MNRIRILSEDEAGQVAFKVNQLEQKWIPRDASSFYSLGAAAYLDAPTRETISAFNLEEPLSGSYQKNVLLNNTLLWEHFSELYLKVKNALQTFYDAPMEYAEGKALPGFHIFNEDPKYALPRSHVPHYDRQYESLNWDEDVHANNAKTFSFTLPLKLPAAGGGLYLWDIELDDVLKMEKSEALNYVKAANNHREAYSAGELVCHSGHQLHRISPWISRPGDQRITLQGHGLYVDKTWQLYW